ncbi:hypothetical protein [Albibacterium profundi]|uniref:PepSY domain-containing protein n=1 Tax=Albibacterium profundi TaxID=3134906 RepID=A0ABV5CCT7_9SPHI
MKKLMLSAAVLAFAGFTATNVNAETTNFPAASEVVMGVQDKTPVNPEDLPDAVKEALAGEEYAEWSVKEAFSVAPADGIPFYEISLQKDQETKVVNLNEAGEVVELPVATESPADPMEPAEPTPTVPSEPTTPSEPTPSEPTPAPTPGM